MSAIVYTYHNAPHSHRAHSRSYSPRRMSQTMGHTGHYHTRTFQSHRLQQMNYQRASNSSEQNIISNPTKICRHECGAIYKHPNNYWYSLRYLTLFWMFLIHVLMLPQFYIIDIFLKYIMTIDMIYPILETLYLFNDYKYRNPYFVR